MLFVRHNSNVSHAKDHGHAANAWFFVLLICAVCVVVPPDLTRAQALPSAPEGSFTIAVIPDTQAYTHGSGGEVTNAVFESNVNWIVDNLDSQRIAFVTHVGDVVDELSSTGEWTVARGLMDNLHGEVPYGISPGNHDMSSPGSTEVYQGYFGAARYTGFDWYGGCYDGDPNLPYHSGNNANSYQLFSAEGHDFIMLHVECNAPDGVLAWADAVLDEHSDRIAIVTTHMYLGPILKPVDEQGYYDDPKGVMQWCKTHIVNGGNSGQEMWDECFSRHANLALILCGDQSRTQTLHLEQTGDHGNTVHSLLSDYMYNSGPMRLLRFLPDENLLEVITYNTQLGELCEGTILVPEIEMHQFTIPLALPEPGTLGLLVGGLLFFPRRLSRKSGAMRKGAAVTADISDT
ncbi:MAG: metallophosphoesterase [Phycisphaerae bacterium]|nr:metallophosphoesterase [Phycisphaerae bacterium]